MRNLLLIATTLAPFAAHSVVATTSKTDPGADASAWTGVGQMSGGSAVAIGPHLVLTAGHIGAGDFLLGNAVYHMVSTDVAPAWKKKGVDLRLVTVNETLPTWYSVADSVSKGATVTMVGYGQTGVVNAASTGYSLFDDFQAHAGTNGISSKETTPGFGPTIRTLLDGAGEATLASGDSGGGWFVNGQLVGISAFVFSKKTGKPDYGWAKPAYFGSGAIDLTNGALSGWLDDELAQDFQTTSPATGMTQPVPEPLGLTALSLGLGAASLRPRRRK